MTVRLGFLGTGYMGQLAHLHSFSQVENCDIVALAEVRAELGEKVAVRYRVPTVYGSHRELLQDSGVDAGMIMEKHKHPMPEFYVFVEGKGRMLLGEQTFDVAAGASVNIPPDELHEVTNPETAVEPLIWVSIGLKAQD